MMKQLSLNISLSYKVNHIHRYNINSLFVVIKTDVKCDVKVLIRFHNYILENSEYYLKYSNRISVAWDTGDSLVMIDTHFAPDRCFTLRKNSRALHG